MTKHSLRINKQTFSRDGVLGRWDYLVCNLKIYGIFVGMIIGVLIPVIHYVVVPVFALLSICALPFAFINMYKRLRDIRGTTDDQLAWQTALTIALCIPYLGIIPAFVLWFKQGVVTSPETAIPLDKLFQGANSDRSTPIPSQTTTIRDLHGLLKDGAITQEEFEEEKRKVLGKTA
jgi:uncharacterized membrane protein YhaH (DUF805 family)